MGASIPSTATRTAGNPTRTICGTVDSRPTANMSTTMPRLPSRSRGGLAATPGNHDVIWCRAPRARPAPSSPATAGSFRRRASSPPSFAASQSRASRARISPSGSG